ncbi:xenotropic and polytropic retrovirus receptor 1 isoform X2 [Drosophila guanche]|uniref:Blast:Xenotropic and polytropic retrovirus receptor 1 n=1 Tax=Drosophila guanche TaxID=7266 RepID=A0A3B0KNP1_DROGU|nr:xenotropic and polytropic retrovirus receptor 1 isoform X2 [Drosophila guanche]SPP86771.1 blast:Xenotropic and polytropic retrovirus receptor 1 [Drosophila guanche]
MKFGKTFETHLTIEWRQQYMRYSDLKTMIKQGVDGARTADDSSHAYGVEAYYKAFEEAFFSECQNELNRVNNFFMEKLAEARRKHATLKLQLLASARVPGHTSSGMSLISQRTEQARPGPVNTFGSRKLMSQRQLRTAYSEFYLSLVLIQNFQSLNETGFRKICKKYDKNLRSSAGAAWFERHVAQAPFTDQRSLQRMVLEVEDLYTFYLAGGDRSRAMTKLRVPPLGQPTPAQLVFRAGLALGMFLMLFIATAISYWRRPPLQANILAFMSLYRGPFTWVIFNFFMAANVTGWQRSGVNHVLIFEIDPRSHLQPATFLEIACTFGILWTLSMLGFLYHIPLNVQDPFVFPLALILIMLLLLVIPLPIMNWPARWWTMRLLGRVMTAPLHYVGFADFWMGDQLNSLVTCLLDHYYIVRFYATSWLRAGEVPPYLTTDLLVPILCCLPAWFRLAQCLRRFRDSGSKSITYLINSGKYSTTFFVVLFSTLRIRTDDGYAHTFANPYTWLLLAASVVSTVYCYLWDVIKDFGLFRIRKGEHIFLREKLVYPQSFYYFVIVENLLLRWFWVLEFTFQHYKLMTPYNARTLASLLEITRRFIWNYVRLENEHLYNCGKFRATRDIHLAALNPRQERMLEDMMDESDGVSNRRHKPDERTRLGKEYF